MKFSVVVCTHNYAHLLPDALRSIAAQTISDFELLIVDDGSTDNTEEVVARFGSRFLNCRYLRKPHTGLAESRNAGVRAASGSLIAFLDADDLWAPHYLQTVQQAFDANPKANLVLCEGITFRSDNGFITEVTFDENLRPLCGPAVTSHDIFSILLAVCPSGMVFSRTLYDQVGPFDTHLFGVFGNDIDWALRALMAGAYCLCLNQRLYLYRRHADNMTNKGANSFEAWLKIYGETLKEIRGNPEIETRARGIIRSHAVRFLTTCSTSEGQALIRSGIETLGGDPYLRLYYIGTHLGLVGCLKLLKRTRNLSRHLFRKPLAIDLSMPPRAIFDDLPG